MTYETFKEYMQRYEQEKEIQKEENDRYEDIVNRVVCENRVSLDYNGYTYYIELEIFKDYDIKTGKLLRKRYSLGKNIVKDIKPNEEFYKPRHISSKYLILDYKGEEYKIVKELASKMIREIEEYS